MTNALTEQSEWTLTYDYRKGPLQWDTNHELRVALTMLKASAVTLLADICDATTPHASRANKSARQQWANSTGGYPGKADSTAESSKPKPAASSRQGTTARPYHQRQPATGLSRSHSRDIAPESS